jgi:hypothetical protein
VWIVNRSLAPFMWIVNRKAEATSGVTPDDDRRNYDVLGLTIRSGVLERWRT